MLLLFSLLSGILPIVGTFPYVRDILHAKTKPHRASFLIWTILGAIAFFTQFAAGATWSLTMSGVDALLTLLIFILAFRKSEGSFVFRDKAALVAAAIGLVLWYFTKQPLIALGITIAVDMTATALTVHKTYLDPGSETLSSWLCSCAGGILAALAVGRWSFGLLLYPVYLAIANGVVAGIIISRAKHITR